MDATFLKKRPQFKVIFLTAILLLSTILIFSFTINKSTKADYSLEAIEILGSTKTASQPEVSITENNNYLAEPPQANLSDYEDMVLHLLNTVRVEHGLAALPPNQSLTDVSRTRSSDMLSRNYFSHYTPEGKNVFNLLRECGIPFNAAGENLGHAIPAGIGTPEAFLNAWMNSPGHAANILQAKYHIIGVGMVENGNRRVVTTVFRN